MNKPECYGTLFTIETAIRFRHKHLNVFFSHYVELKSFHDENGQ